MTLPIPDHHSGLFSRLLDADRCVDAAAWRHHRETLGHVGKCRRCQNPLRPLTPYRVGAVDWYPAECTGAGCDYETSAHGPRPAAKPTPRGGK